MKKYLNPKINAEQFSNAVAIADQEKIQALNELFGLSSLSKQLRRIDDIEARIEKFLDYRDGFVKQMETYRHNIEIIYNENIPKPYVLSDLCHYLIKNAELSSYLIQSTSMIPNQDHEIIFIGPVKPKKNPIILFN